MSLPAWWPTAASLDPAQSSGPNLWQELAHATADLRPRQAAGVVVRQLHDHSGPYHILKNPQAFTYLRLSPREHWLWEHMNGANTVQDLVVAYYLEYGTFAFGLVTGLVQQLDHERMLAEHSPAVFAEVSAVLAERTFLNRLMRPIRVLLTRQWAIGGLNRHLDRLYRYGGWLFFTFPAQVVHLVVSLVGGYLFIRLLNDPRFQLLDPNWGASAVILWLITIGLVVVHELAHALAVKHYGRDVHHGGLMFYFGLPTAFVDTTDIWLEGKRARLTVTWAGPYTGFIISGLCSIAAWLWPDHALTPTLFRTASLALFMSMLNMNPLLKLDGYYLLSDGLEITRLRERSLFFIQHKFAAKLLNREHFSRDEVIFVVFGLLSALWTAYAIYIGLVFWNTRIAESVHRLFASRVNLFTVLVNLLLIGLALSFLMLIVYQLYQLAHALLARLQKAGAFANPLRLATGVGLGALALALVPRWTTPEIGPLLNLTIGTAACAMGSGLALSVAASWRGSPHRGGAFLIAFALGALALGHIFQPSRNIFNAVGLGLIAVTTLLNAKLLLGLRGSWRAASAILFGAGCAAWLVNAPEAQLLATLLMAGGLWHWQALRLPAITPDQSIAQPTTLPEQLWDAFEVLAEAAVSQMKLAFGIGATRHLQKRFNQLSRTRNWNLTFTNGQLTPPARLIAADFAELLATALTALFDEASRYAGEAFTRLALARGYDALSWEQRETASEHILHQVRWAAGLAESLTQTQSDTIARLERAPLFVTFTREEVEAVARRFRAEHFGPGEAIVRAGEAGDRFYILRRGRVEVLQPDAQGAEQKVNELVSGDYFGEAALLSGAPRNATIRALTPVEALSLRKNDFDKLVRAGFEGRGKVDVALRRVGLLRHIPIFREFESFELQLVAAQLESLPMAAGQTVFQQGDLGDRFYIVESGEVSIRLHLPDGSVVEPARRGPGEYFGEIALLTKLPRTAEVVATLPSTLLALGAEAFDELVRESRSFRLGIERASSRRRLMTNQIIQRVSQAGVSTD